MADMGESQIELETGTADEQFERLRQRFRVRLRKEQALLATLTEALGSPKVAAASIFLDIRSYAHRLRGAALVFGFQQLGDRAKAVELAAIPGSLDANGQKCHPLVLSTMQILATNLADELASGAPGPPGTRALDR